MKEEEEKYSPPRAPQGFGTQLTFTLLLKYSEVRQIILHKKNNFWFPANWLI